jgi:hypothetical protein
MESKTKSSFIGLFLFALAPFAGGLQAVAHSMTYGGAEHNFIADNWIFPSTFLLALVFALGWAVGSLDEYLVLNNQRNLAIFTYFCFIIVFVAIAASSLLFFSGFAKSILQAGAYFILSSFLFRLSTMKSDVIAKLRDLLINSK